jgi:hypothetical protein
MRNFIQKNMTATNQPAHRKTSPLGRAIPGSVSGRHGGRCSVKTQDCVREKWTQETPFSIGCLPQLPPAHSNTSPLERAIPGSVSGRHGGRSSVKTQDCAREEWTRETPFSIGCLPQQILKVSKADSAPDQRRGVLGTGGQQWPLLLSYFPTAVLPISPGV